MSKNSTKIDLVRFYSSASVEHCNLSGNGVVGGGEGRGGGSTYPELYTALAVLVSICFSKYSQDFF